MININIKKERKLLKRKTFVKTRKQAEEILKEALVGALGVDEDEVNPAKRIIQDLNAESIDFMDVKFRLEKGFGVKEIALQEIFIIGNMTMPDFIHNGKLTKKGMDELQRRMPYLDIAGFKLDPRVSEFSALITVQVLLDFLCHELKIKK